MVLDLLAGEDEFTTFCGVLTPFAESDFRSDAVQGETVGVYQQNPRWWPAATQGTWAQGQSWLHTFKVCRAAEYFTDKTDPVLACWIVQRWKVPNGGTTWPDPGPGFGSAAETVNYSRRVDMVRRIIETRRLPG